MKVKAPFQIQPEPIFNSMYRVWGWQVSIRGECSGKLLYAWGYSPRWNWLYLPRWS